MSKKDFTQKLLELKHKFTRYNIREIVFLAYLALLTVFVLFIRVARIENTWISIKLWSCPFALAIVLVSLILLILWNASTKSKNLIQTYIWWRDNEALVNCILLLIITAVYFSISDIVWKLDTVTEITSPRFIKVWLLIWFIMTLVSVIKNAQINWKKTKIINIVDEEHKQNESTKDEIKRWLFDDEDKKD